MVHNIKIMPLFISWQVIAGNGRLGFAMYNGLVLVVVCYGFVVLSTIRRRLVAANVCLVRFA